MVNGYVSYRLDANTYCDMLILFVESKVLGLGCVMRPLKYLPFPRSSLLARVTLGTDVGKSRNLAKSETVE